MDTSMNTSIMLLLLVAMIPIVGILMALTPYLMKKSECFAVTVPEMALDDPYLKRLKQHYLIIVLVVTLLVTVLNVIAALTGNELSLVLLFTVGIFVVIVVSYGLMLRNRSKVRRYKQEQGWTSTGQAAVAVVSETATPKAISLKWNLLYIPIIALTLLIGFFGYDAMPQQIPMQTGFDGEVTRTVAKNFTIIILPAMIQAFFAVCLFFSHWMIIRSKRQPNPSAPASSSLAYGMFAHAQSMYLLALGLVLCALMMMFPFSFIGVVTLMQGGILVMVAVFVAILGAVAISVVYGQGGARVMARIQSAQTMPSDDDQYWKLGVFYVNSDDPSLFLLERFGVGWTFNFGRPAVWVIFGLVAVVTAAFIAAIFALT